MEKYPRNDAYFSIEFGKDYYGMDNTFRLLKKNVLVIGNLAEIWLKFGWIDSKARLASE